MRIVLLHRIAYPHRKRTPPLMSTLLQETGPSATGAAAMLAEVLSDIAASPLSSPASSATIQRLLHALGVGAHPATRTP